MAAVNATNAAFFGTGSVCRSRRSHRPCMGPGPRAGKFSGWSSHSAPCRRESHSARPGRIELRKLDCLANRPARRPDPNRRISSVNSGLYNGCDRRVYAARGAFSGDARRASRSERRHRGPGSRAVAPGARSSITSSTRGRARPIKSAMAQVVGMTERGQQRLNDCARTTARRLPDDLETIFSTGR